MKTWLQTVDVHFKNSSKVYHTLELAPLPKGGLCSYIKDDVVYSDSVKKIVWEWDGTITQTDNDSGTVKIWYPRPTLADAIAYKDTEGNDGGFFQFHRDGSVEAYCYDASYYWSAATYEAEPLRANYGPDENMGYWF